MHLIHVWILASAVPPASLWAVDERGRHNVFVQQAFHDPGEATAAPKTGPTGRGLPLFASHA